MRLIALFNLKAGVPAKDYETWARTTDLPTVRALPSITQFEVFRVAGLLGSDRTSPYAYAEIIDVQDMAQFGKDIATPAMSAIAACFHDLADVTFLTTENIEDGDATADKAG